VLSHAGRKIEAGVTTRVGPKDRNACELGSAIASSSINLDACISVFLLRSSLYVFCFFFPFVRSTVFEGAKSTIFAENEIFSRVLRTKTEAATPAALSDNPVICQ